MPNVNDVIKALEFCLMPATEEELMSDVCSHDDCPYYRKYRGGECVNAVAKDALALLKSQRQDAQQDYEAAIEMAEYCERYEPTYDPETGAM